MTLARLLLDQGAKVQIHDPYVYPTDQNLRKTGLSDVFSRDLQQVVQGAEFIFVYGPPGLY